MANLPQYSFPHEAAIRINLPVLLFSVAVAVATGLSSACGPPCNWPAPRPPRRCSRHAQGGRQRPRTPHAQRLIAGQIALTLLMLAGAGAAMEGFIHLLNIPAWLRSAQHHVGRHSGPRRHLQDLGRTRSLFRAAARQGGRSARRHLAAISTNATPPSNGNNTTFQILGQAFATGPARAPQFRQPGVFPRPAHPSGRRAASGTGRESPRRTVAVVNQTFARRYFPMRIRSATPSSHLPCQTSRRITRWLPAATDGC